MSDIYLVIANLTNEFRKMGFGICNDKDKINEAGGINKFFENYARNFRQIIEAI